MHKDKQKQIGLKRFFSQKGSSLFFFYSFINKPRQIMKNKQLKRVIDNKMVVTAGYGGIGTR
ncbi:MAG: hypothetical protein ACRCZQ_10075, partial [Bacteroidales bacterium]